MAKDNSLVPAANQPEKAPAKAKHSFSNAERFAVWRAYQEACFWCGEPLSFRATEIDHVIAESLADHPARYASLLKELGLPETYDVNDFPNWVPACRVCNGRKGATTFRPVPMIFVLLERTQKMGEAAREYATEILSDRA
jgi:5-methylcytosine-specific restriction endonuclease McrA